MPMTRTRPVPAAQGRRPLYLYMVSASTSPNHTLSPAWKFSPWSSSVATSPPPLSWGREGVGAVAESLLLSLASPYTTPAVRSLPASARLRPDFTSRVLMRGTGVTGSRVHARLVLKENSTDSVPMMVQQELSLSSALFASLGQGEAWEETQGMVATNMGEPA